MIKSKKNIVIGIICALIISLIFIMIYVNADEYANKVTIKQAKITSIQTGSEPFDKNNDPGNDLNESNEFVRTFDTITYNMEFEIKPKENVDGSNLEDRTVLITMGFSKEESKYIDFVYEKTNEDIDVTISEDNTSITYPIFGINTYGVFTKSIKVNVNSAPNGFEFNPTFTIKESTDKDSGVILGKNNDTNYYEYNDGKYLESSSMPEFTNYMPTKVSSKQGIDIFVVSSNQSQLSTLNGENGRYLTFGLAVQLLGDNNNKNIKGLQLPNNISFDIDVTSSNNIEDAWVRPYTNDKVDNINPVAMELPYNTSGNIKISKKNNSTYTVSISNFNNKYNNETATGNTIENNRAVFSTFAITVFSKRLQSDGKNDINVTLSANSANEAISKTQDNKDIKETTITNNNATIVNEYRDQTDYSVSSAFVDKENYISLSNKYSKERNYASVTRGDEIAYKSSFNFNNSTLQTGIIQIIKIDPNAYELMKLNEDNDYIIDINCNDEKCSLTNKDFSVKYVTGDFDKDNYDVINYNEETLDESLLKEDVDTVMNQCSIVKRDYDNLNSDQIMNLYGGPCLKAKKNVEKTYTNIKDLNGKRITKIILETKKDRLLDSTINIDFIVGIRVKNVKDITQTYQAETLIKSKDNKNTIYFIPDVATATDYNNYIKTIYNGTNPTVSDKTYADSLKIVSFKSENNISITNKREDGSKKVSYNTKDNDTLKYKVDVKISDNSINVGSDDVWYIKSLKVTISLPNALIYRQNKDYLDPTTIISNKDGTTTLIYDLSYTKPNTTIKPIYFDAVFKTDIKGVNNEVVVVSQVDAINVNNEVDTSAIGSSISSETIYVTGEDGIIITEEVGNLGNVVEKDQEFNYNLNIYNNSNENVNNLSIMDVLPYNNDELKSKFSGSYKVKVVLPSNLTDINIYCLSDKASNVVKDISSTLNEWETCNITSDYVETLAFKIDNIKINANEKLNPIVVQLKPSKNDYADVYNNKFYSESDKLIKSQSSVASVRVVNRTISGQVFMDNNDNGIKDDSKYFNDLDVSLCLLDSENTCNEVSSIKTDKDGKYSFNKLDTGIYKLNIQYDSDKYDVTDRYFTQDESKDSDAYKLSDTNGIAEISGKENGIKVTADIENIENMDLGLISKRGFEVDIRKGINQIDLQQDGNFSTRTYDFEKTISLSVKKANNLGGKVRYGFLITNNSTQPGYVSMIEEIIPNGMSFNPNYEENKKWFSVDGSVFTDALKDDLLKPGEQRTLEIVLDISSRQEVGVFSNEVAIVELTPYVEEERINDQYNNDENFEIGESLTYAGVNWHVINDDGTNVTLLADESGISMSHTSSSKDVYKWSTSQINKYINGEWLNTNSIDTGVLISNSICDDASGLEVASYGGTLISEGKCQSGIYNDYKVRLLTTNEFDSLVSRLSNVDFLVGTKYWTMNSQYVSVTKDEFGNVNNSVSNQAMIINKTTSPRSYNAYSKAIVRPVITISKNNILVQ